jgi:hypothetical protein
MIILKRQLPCDETVFVQKLNDYKAAVAVHSQTTAIPAPVPEFELFRLIVERGGKVSIVDGDDPLPVEDLPAPIQAITALERNNPFTHRGHREQSLGLDLILRSLVSKINALDAEIAVLANRTPAPLPSIPVTHLITVVKAVDDAIKAERAKL